MRPAGSPLYAAPELMDADSRAASPQGYDAAKSDMWSCGVILYALLTSTLPFDGDDMRALINLVVRGVPRRPLPRRCGPEAADLLHQLLVRQPSDRLSAADALEHAWLRPVADPSAVEPRLRAVRTMPDSLPSTTTATAEVHSGTAGDEGGVGEEAQRRGLSATVDFFKQLVKQERRRELGKRGDGPPGEGREIGKSPGELGKRGDGPPGEGREIGGEKCMKAAGEEGSGVDCPSAAAPTMAAAGAAGQAVHPAAIDADTTEAIATSGSGASKEAVAAPAVHAAAPSATLTETVAGLDVSDAHAADESEVQEGSVGQARQPGSQLTREERQAIKAMIDAEKAL